MGQVIYTTQPNGMIAAVNKLKHICLGKSVSAISSLKILLECVERWTRPQWTPFWGKNGNQGSNWNRISSSEEKVVNCFSRAQQPYSN